MENYEEKIAQAIATPTDKNLSANAPVIAMFLAPFRPILPPRDNGDNMTSAEIKMALEDVTEVTLNEITEVMLYLGYRLHQNSYNGIEWAMSHPEVEE